jgi:hypothetical protein
MYPLAIADHPPAAWNIAMPRPSPPPSRVVVCTPSRDHGRPWDAPDPRRHSTLAANPYESPSTDFTAASMTWVAWKVARSPAASRRRCSSSARRPTLLHCLGACVAATAEGAQVAEELCVLVVHLSCHGARPFQPQSPVIGSQQPHRGRRAEHPTAQKGPVGERERLVAFQVTLHRAKMVSPSGQTGHCELADGPPRPVLVIDLKLTTWSGHAPDPRAQSPPFEVGESSPDDVLVVRPGHGCSSRSGVCLGTVPSGRG